MARALQGVEPQHARRLLGSLGPALAASAALHAAALGAFGGLARGAYPGHFQPGSSATGLLHASLVAAQAPRALSSPPPAEPRSVGASAAATGSAPLPGTRYYPPGELEQRPLIMSHVEPEFPERAPYPIGTVVLQLYISERGTVDRVAVESPNVPAAFAEAARNAFGGARFRPGMRHGAPVKSLLRIEVGFGVAPEHALPVPRDRSGD